MARKTKCYTFYSYKGGSGRSTTAVNTVNHLVDAIGADSEHPILLVDADLESAGLTFYFEQEKKFSNKFTHCGSINTTHLLAGPCDPSQYFNKSSIKQPMNDKTKKRFMIHFDDENPSIEELFSGILLPNSDWDMLEYIVRHHNLFKEQHQDNDIKKQYDIINLLDKLRKIHNDTKLSADEVIREKYEAIDDFLPSSIFTDISRFFGRPAGTVRFLGVDVNYKDEQLAHNDSVQQIKNLLKACRSSENNYKAVVFDSGAGTQSSANAFHQISDVLVYCMRPTMQFARGTYLNVENYFDQLRQCKDTKKGADSPLKNVVIIPTAVPDEDDFAALRRDCFEEINDIVADFSDVVDGYFCSPEKALCEVDVFKWRELILGVADGHSNLDADVRAIVNSYSDPRRLPKDAAKAYATYRELAERIVFNSKDPE